MLNREIFDAVCAEFHDNYFEDKWHELDENSIMKAATRTAMHKALLKLYSFRNTTKQMANCASGNGWSTPYLAVEDV